LLASSTTLRWQMRTDPKDQRHELFWRQLAHALTDAVPTRATLSSDRTGTRTIGPSSMGRVISPAAAGSITDAMVQAVEGPLGRQFTTGAKVPGVTTAGKSGTAELGGTGEPHSWFIGFAPAESPRVAIAVLVEQAGRGAEVAAPIAGDLMARYLESGS